METQPQPQPQPTATVFCLKLDGKLTYEFYRELEGRILSVIQRYKDLEIDLSDVTEVDLCGIHLIGLLQSAGVIVASSPAVESAARNLLETLNSAALGRVKRREFVAMSAQPAGGK